MANPYILDQGTPAQPDPTPVDPVQNDGDRVSQFDQEYARSLGLDAYDTAAANPRQKARSQLNFLMLKAKQEDLKQKEIDDNRAANLINQYRLESTKRSHDLQGKLDSVTRLLDGVEAPKPTPATTALGPGQSLALALAGIAGGANSVPGVAQATGQFQQVNEQNRQQEDAYRMKEHDAHTQRLMQTHKDLTAQLADEANYHQNLEQHDIQRVGQEIERAFKQNQQGKADAMEAAQRYYQSNDPGEARTAARVLESLDAQNGTHMAPSHAELDRKVQSMALKAIDAYNRQVALVRSQTDFRDPQVATVIGKQFDEMAQSIAEAYDLKDTSRLMRFNPEVGSVANAKLNQDDRKIAETGRHNISIEAFQKEAQSLSKQKFDWEKTIKWPEQVKQAWTRIGLAKDYYQLALQNGDRQLAMAYGQIVKDGSGPFFDESTKNAFNAQVKYDSAKQVWSHAYDTALRALQANPDNKKKTADELRSMIEADKTVAGLAKQVIDSKTELDAWTKKASEAGSNLSITGVSPEDLMKQQMAILQGLQKNPEDGTPSAPPVLRGPITKKGPIKKSGVKPKTPALPSGWKIER